MSNKSFRISHKLTFNSNSFSPGRSISADLSHLLNRGLCLSLLLILLGGDGYSVNVYQSDAGSGFTSTVTDAACAGLRKQQQQLDAHPKLSFPNLCFPGSSMKAKSQTHLIENEAGQKAEGWNTASLAMGEPRGVVS